MELLGPELLWFSSTRPPEGFFARAARSARFTVVAWIEGAHSPDNQFRADGSAAATDRRAVWLVVTPLLGSAILPLVSIDLALDGGGHRCCCVAPHRSTVPATTDS